MITSEAPLSADYSKDRWTKPHTEFTFTLSYTDFKKDIGSDIVQKI